MSCYLFGPEIKIWIKTAKLNQWNYCLVFLCLHQLPASKESFVGRSGTWKITSKLWLISHQSMAAYVNDSNQSWKNN